MKSPNNPKTERIMAEAHALIGARLDKAMAGAANEQDRDVCPDCGGHLRAKWSGVECGVCGYTFCY